MAGLFAERAVEKPRRRPQRPGVRLVDVANAAGVSTMTASRALSTPDLVARTTHDRVLRKALDLGYIPDLNARGLKSQRSGMMAAVIPTITNSLMANVVKGMSDVLHAGGFQLLLGNSGFSLDEEEKLVTGLLARRPDALYLTGTEHNRLTCEILRNAGIPVVEGGNACASPIDSLVGLSNIDAARSAVDHLLDRGHRAIAFVGGHARDNDRMRDRFAGYRLALADRGIDLDDAQRLEVDIELEGGAEAMRRLLRSPVRPTAVFCAVDTIAAGAIFECQRQRMKVPADIAVVGFGDLSIASQIVPSLTTVRVPGREIGERAAEIMMARCRGGGPVIHDVGYRLVVRDSS